MSGRPDDTTLGPVLLAPVATLIRWLGPWSRGLPTGVTRQEVWLGPTRQLRAFRYRPRRAPLGAYLISPGLHHDGPADPRMDRLGRILAQAGFVVLAPFLPDHLALLASANATADLMLAFDDLEALTRRESLPAPSLFSVSFGSNPSIRLCGDPRYAGRVGGLWLFGGFADFTGVCRFAAFGEVEHDGELLALPCDPTNAPAVFLNVVAHLGVDTDAQAQLARAWRTMCRRSWNRADLKRLDALRPVAQQIADDDLPVELRPLFLQGCGLAAGSREILLEALGRATPHLGFADPTEALAAVQAPVVIAHGRDDNVVCYHQAARLRALLPAGHPHRFFVTGLFGHGGARLPSPRQIAAEVATLLGLAHAMAALPLGGLGQNRRPAESAARSRR